MDKQINLKKGAVFILFSALSFSVAAVFVKFAARNVSVDKIIAFRFGISFIYILIVLAIRKILKKNVSLKTAHINMHIFRALFSTLGLVLFYKSLKYIPLVDANLLYMSNALFVPVIGAFFLKSKVTKKHWIAIIIGFIGISFILKPGNEILGFYSFIALLAGLSVGFAFILVRELCRHDTHYVCMFYMFLITFILSGSWACATWQTPDLHTILLLIGAGILGSLYQDFMTRGSFYVPAGIVSSLLYTTLIFTIFFDWFFINHIPDFGVWTGIILVILSSVLTIYAARFQKPKIKQVIQKESH